MPNEKDSSGTAESPTSRSAATEPDSPRAFVARSWLPPGLKRLIQENSERVKKEEERLVAILLRDYPAGELPAWGVTMCLLYLREKHADECGSDEDCRLNLVQVSADDQTWALNDVVQGGVRTLISWITGRTGTSLLEEEYYATLWYGSACFLVREELARRAASKSP